MRVLLLSTKARLAGSLKELMAEQSLDKITVKEIVERCGVNRQTFYYHFRDMYDLLDWMFIHEGAEFLKMNPVYDCDDDGQSVLKTVCSYLQEHKSSVLSIYHSMGRELLCRYLCKEIYKMLNRVVTRRVAVHKISEFDLHTILHFYKHAFVGTMLDWVEKGLPGTPEDVVVRYQPLLKGMFDATMKKMA
ncbi:MAG TPA: TetR/AcrR family transcriptional regulator C-terminal domain-containing protein [Sphaerochaeta sp.]|nr:TetR/AcrR family transcriptional regulator C-terminal domain-containing protein [Sphaerochaeta sp.]HQB54667.1 TetR/AcrR family transcriptional regulator C-terminal domain-containing protein [Sphaerochaeta sp.]